MNSFVADALLRFNSDHPNVDIIQNGILTKAGDFDYSTMISVYLLNEYDVSFAKKVVAQVQVVNDDVSKTFSVNVQTVVGVEPSIWKSWTIGSPFPRELKSLHEIRSKVHTDIGFVPSGAHLFLYVKSKRMDACFEVGKRFVNALGKNVEKTYQVNGFKYMDGRDLTGFVDGTRNSSASHIILDTAIIHEDDDANISEYAGGSYAFHSIFIHDLKKFESLSADEKSKIIGRDFGKIDSNANPRLPDAYSHVGKNGEYPSSPASNYHINRGYGPMIRQSWPFGTSEENGLAFLAFSRSLKEFENALNRMLGINTRDESQMDNLFQISKPKHANYYYCPSVKQLATLNK